MRKSVVILASAAVVAFVYASGIAQAGPMPGVAHGVVDFDDSALVERVRGGHRGGGHRGGGHRGGGHRGHAFAPRLGGHGFDGHRRHRGQFFGYANPYYYSDYWYSHRYYRWVCPYSYY